MENLDYIQVKKYVEHFKWINCVIHEIYLHKTVTKKKKDLGGDEHSDLYPEWPYVLIGPEMTQFLPVGQVN